MAEYSLGSREAGFFLGVVGGGCEARSGDNRLVDNGQGSGGSVEWRARDACLERAGLREDYGLRGEAWVLVLQATAL